MDKPSITLKELDEMQGPGTYEKYPDSIPGAPLSNMPSFILEAMIWDLQHKVLPQKTLIASAEGALAYFFLLTPCVTLFGTMGVIVAIPVAVALRWLFQEAIHNLAWLGAKTYFRWKLKRLEKQDGADNAQASSPTEPPSPGSTEQDSLPPGGSSSDSEEL